MTLNFKRVLHLISSELRAKWKIYLLVLLVSFSLLIHNFHNSQSSLLSVANEIINQQSQNIRIVGNTVTSMPHRPNTNFKFHLHWFPTAYFLIASILTSLAFSEYHDKRNRQFSISLPASILEKWLSKVVLYVVLAPTVILALYLIFAHFSYGWDEKQVRLGLQDPFLWKHLKSSVLYQCIILLGALFFKKYSLFKMALASVVLYLFYNMVEVITFVVTSDTIELFKNGGTPGINSLSEILFRAGYHYSSSSSLWYHLGISELTLLTIVAVITLALSFAKYRELEA